MRCYIVSETYDINQAIQEANTLGIGDIRLGIPPRYNSMVTVDMLPYVYEEADPIPEDTTEIDQARATVAELRSRDWNSLTAEEKDTLLQALLKLV